VQSPARDPLLVSHDTVTMLLGSTISTASKPGTVVYSRGNGIKGTIYFVINRILLYLSTYL
jgi:hypothetical protein